MEDETKGQEEINKKTKEIEVETEITKDRVEFLHLCQGCEEQRGGHCK